MAAELSLRVDGSCGWDGRTRNAHVRDSSAAGWGFVLSGVPGHDRIERCGLLADESKPEVVAYAALEIGLRFVTNVTEQLGGGTLTVHNKSGCVVRQMTGVWKCNQPYLRRFHDRCKSLIEFLAQHGFTTAIVQAKLDDDPSTRILCRQGRRQPHVRRVQTPGAHHTGNHALKEAERAAGKKRRLQPTIKFAWDRPEVMTDGRAVWQWIETLSDQDLRRKLKISVRPTCMAKLLINPSVPEKLGWLLADLQTALRAEGLTPPPMWDRYVQKVQAKAAVTGD